MTGTPDYLAVLPNHLGEPLSPSYAIVNGGVLTGQNTAQRMFVKRYAVDMDAQRKAEAEGLRMLAEKTSFVVPRILYENVGIMVIPWLDGSGSEEAWSPAEFGHCLGQMHEITGEAYGYGHTTFCGPTPQDNSHHLNWEAFFWEQRLEPLLRRIEFSSFGEMDWRRRVEAVRDVMKAEIEDAVTGPRLVHGDLWQGNVLKLGPGTGLIDPALYFGHPEVDLGMLTLFGSPAPSFWDGYTKVRPLRSGFFRRASFYNLFHIMNHCVLFGGGYWEQLDREIRSF